MTQTNFYLHDDLINTVLTFLYQDGELNAQELHEDLEFYIKWSNAVPSMFLSCQLLETRYWVHLANPMCKFYPYHPRKFFCMRPEEVWGPTLLALGHMISREAIRSAKTYKRCAIRWILDCVENVDLFYWYELKQKLFNRIHCFHFHRGAPSSFVREALSQICVSCTPGLNASEF